jgi:hypothetical protein
MAQHRILPLKLQLQLQSPPSPATYPAQPGSATSKPHSRTTQAPGLHTTSSIGTSSHWRHGIAMRTPVSCTATTESTTPSHVSDAHPMPRHVGYTTRRFTARCH